MTIQFGATETTTTQPNGSQDIIRNTIENGKTVVTSHYFKMKEMVKDDSEELSKFLEFQRDCKGSTHTTFSRELSAKGNRFVVKEWRA